jgi:chemotaxis signal transduction protein
VARVERVFAVCALAGVRFAIASEQVVQAMLRPADLVSIPGERPGTELFVLRGQVIPLVDLRPFLSGASADPPPNKMPAKVMVMRDAGQWLAISIDELIDMRRVDERSMVRVRHTDAGEDMFHTVLAPGPAEAGREALPVWVLDVSALLKRLKVWGAEAGEHIAAAEQEQQMGSDLRRFAMMDCHGQVVALAADQVAFVEPMPTLQHFMGQQSDLLGIAKWRGRDLAVMSMSGVLGVRTDPVLPPLMAVLRHGERVVGVAVHKALEIRPLALDALQAAEHAGLALHPALKGVLHLDSDQRVVVLDAEGLMAGEFSSAKSGAAATGDKYKAGENLNTHAHVVFRAGQQWAMPIQNIQAIVTFPAHTDPSSRGHSAQHGSFVWRKQAVPLWDLASLMRGLATKVNTETRVLVVKIQGRLLGLVIEQLLMLLPPRQGELNRMRDEDGVVKHLIAVQGAGRAKSYWVLDEPALLSHMQA